MSGLGFMYEGGRGGLSQNNVQAIIWYGKAADAGDADAVKALKRLTR